MFAYSPFGFHSDIWKKFYSSKLQDILYHANTKTSVKKTTAIYFDEIAE